MNQNMEYDPSERPLKIVNRLKMPINKETSTIEWE